jgi:hypothetical protein
MPVDFDFAIPVLCATESDNENFAVQVATMRSEKDALTYGKSCTRYGGKVLSTWKSDVSGNWFVRVIYYKDENGKIGPKYS